MTEPKAQSQEPSMEEILASIRRIISENDPPAGSATAKPATAVGPGASASVKPQADDVLELTDMVGADGKVVNLAEANVEAVEIPEPPSANAIEEAPAMVDPIPEPARPQPIDVSADDVELSSPAPRRMGADASVEDSLVGAGAASLSTAAFAALAHELGRNNGEAPVTGSMPLGSGRTLEELVKEMIRPMLREWLDANLPGMVERMVKREIERLVRRAED